MEIVMSSQRLVKAKLFSLDSNDYNVEFMFNPNQLNFSRGIKLNEPSGARSRHGQKKVSFADPESCTLNLQKILFDTYEEGTDVYKKYIDRLVKSVQFINPNERDDKNKRPPIYLFIWGANDYLRCFVESLKYQLTMFLPDGTPVRATADLTLKEVDLPRSLLNPRTPTEVDRYGDSRDARSS